MAVFITGASSGIGESCARAFAQVGHELILVARRIERLEALAKTLPTKVTTVHLDVTKRDDVERWVKEHPDVVRRVSVLVNNAGGAMGLDPIQSGKPEDWDAMIDVNLKGLLYVSRALLPALIENEGHVINMGSVAGRWNYPNGNVYAATKFAVRGLTQAMRIDLHATGVRVTEIAPGMVETEFSDVRFGGDKARAEKVYAGTRPLTADDIAECVVWAAARPAHVNVQEIVIFPTDQSTPTMVRRDPA